MGLMHKVRGTLLVNLNILERPIAKKYCEGKMKRTKKLKLKVPEIVLRKANCSSVFGASLALAYRAAFYFC